MLAKLLKLKLRPDYNKWNKLGEELFELSSSHGMPLEISLDELKKQKKITKDQTIIIVFSYLHKEIEHRLASGFEFMGKQHEKLIKRNVKIIEKLIKTGENESTY